MDQLMVVTIILHLPPARADLLHMMYYVYMGYSGCERDKQLNKLQYWANMVLVFVCQNRFCHPRPTSDFGCIDFFKRVFYFDSKIVKPFFL